MNKDQKVVVVIGVAMIAAGLLDMAKTTKQQKAIRKEIEDKLDMDLLASWTARDRVINRIRSGRYRNFADAWNDYQFECIAETIDM